MKYLLVMFTLLCEVSFKIQKNHALFNNNNWAQTLSQAKKEKKPIFFYAWSPKCGPCIVMDKEVFNNEKLISFYKNHYIIFKVNIDNKEGEILSKKYSITVLPAFLYFNSDGEIVHITTGGKTSNELIEDGENAFDPNKAFFSLKRRYDSGERSTELLYSYSTAPGITEYPSIYEKVSAEYFKNQPINELTSSKNMNYIFDSYTNFDSPTIKYFLSNIPRFIHMFGDKKVNTKIRYIIRNKASEIGKFNSEKRFQYFIKSLKLLQLYNSVQWIQLSRIYFLLGHEKRDWESYADAVLQYGNEYAEDDTYTLREAATYINAFVSEKDIIRKADQITKQAIAVDKSYDNLLIRAKILHKLEHDIEATKLAKEAIAIAAIKKIDSSEAIQLLFIIKQK